MKILLTLAVAMTAAVLSGCIVSGHHGSAVIIPALHVHSDHCGHYSHGGSWYHNEGHRHHSSCGHHFKGGVWIVRD